MANKESNEFKNKLLLFYLDRLAEAGQKEEFVRFYNGSFEQFLMESNTDFFTREELIRAKKILSYEKNIIKGIAI